MQTVKTIKSQIIYPQLGIVEEIEEEIFEDQELDNKHD